MIETFYNYERYFVKAIKIVASQVYSNFDCIIDDGSVYVILETMARPEDKRTLYFKRTIQAIANSDSKATTLTTIVRTSDASLRGLDCGVLSNPTHSNHLGQFTLLLFP